LDLVPTLISSGWASGINAWATVLVLGLMGLAWISGGLRRKAHREAHHRTWFGPLIVGAVPVGRLDCRASSPEERRDGWRLALNVANILDNNYVAACYYSAPECFYGERRKLTASLRYRW
jgi:hypothetical protein